MNKGMGKFRLLGVVLGIVLLAGISYWWVSTRDNIDEAASDTNTATAANDSQAADLVPQNQQDGTPFTGTIEGLSTNGSPRMCNFSYSAGQGFAQGEAYTDGRGSVAALVDLYAEPSTNAQMAILVKGNRNYTVFATPDSRSGYERALDNKTALPVQTTLPLLATDQTLSMSCADWIVDEQILSVPEGISFTKL